MRRRRSQDSRPFRRCRGCQGSSGHHAGRGGVSANPLLSQLISRTHGQDRLFLRSPDGRSFTYGDLSAQTARLAQALQAKGVKPGDRVAVQIEKCPEAVFLYLACLRIGAVYLPLNTAYTLAETTYFIKDAEPALMVAAPECQADMAKLVPVALTLDALAQDQFSPVFENCQANDDDLAAILYTSGTTGRSKGAMITLGNLTSNAKTLADCWHFTESDVLLHALPIYHAHGLFVAINTVLVAGASMILLPRFDADAVLEMMKDATVMMGVPTFYTRLLAHPSLNRQSTHHMRLFISGSAPLLAQTHAEWRERTGHAILERYGLTE
ncbi:MAG: AMP-binding protein, partial [Alphaproteobacteria bacterium]|nr:AMP-binding protein [Alphaproteobacteria bacterium]